jgi:hypothetical protein
MDEVQEDSDSELYTSSSEVFRFCIIFEIFTAVTMKNAVFWDIETQFIPHRRHNTSPLQSLAG